MNLIKEGTDVRGFVTVCDYQCGVEGSAAEMLKASREIESVGRNASASVRPFLSYFGFEGVLEVLIRERLKGKDVKGMLPPRKFWSRGGVRDRVRIDREGRKVRRESKDIRRESIRRRVMKLWKAGELEKQEWGVKLIAFWREIERKVTNGEVRFSAPEMLQIAKGAKNGHKEFRTVAKFNELEDRVVMSLTTAYLRDRLEMVLNDACYSFRRDSRIDHEMAVGKLQQWRAAHDGSSMFVAECDIRKFFDSIPHETVRRRWSELAPRLGLESAARQVVEAYLNVYSYDGECEGGLPQGGSLSTVLANFVLADADDKVLASGDGLFYARYCDDVILAHTDETACRAAMTRYAQALEKLGLPMHPRKGFAYRDECGRRDAAYYEIKTKGPFRWAEPQTGEWNVAPWVSFVGSQIRYDGATRIRKESVEKHIRSLGRETAKAVRELEKGELNADAFAWFSRFRNRLIRKGVGYVTAKLKDCDCCWAGAFGKVTTCGETRQEMRRLDRVREKMLTKVATLLRERGAEVKKAHRYKGNPFSYYAFLMKTANRPTNLRRKLSRCCYSLM